MRLPRHPKFRRRGIAAMLAAAPLAGAQSYPSRPVHVIVGVPAGTHPT